MRRSGRLLRRSFILVSRRTVAVPESTVMQQAQPAAACVAAATYLESAHDADA